MVCTELYGKGFTCTLSYLNEVCTNLGRGLANLREPPDLVFSGFSEEDNNKFFSCLSTPYAFKEPFTINSFRIKALGKLKIG